MCGALSLRKVAGADGFNAALYGALAGADGGGDGADGDTGSKGADDCAVDVVDGCGLDSGAGDGCILGAADRLCVYAGGGIGYSLGVVVAVLVVGGDQLAAVGRVAVFGAGDGVRGLRAGSKEDVRERARLVALVVAIKGRRDAGPCFGGDGLGVVRAFDPLRVGGASGGLGAVLDGPRHFLQGGILFLAAHVLPLAAGCCGSFGGSVRLFQADGKLGAAAGLGVLCDGGAVQAPRLVHDL